MLSTNNNKHSWLGWLTLVALVTISTSSLRALASSVEFVHENVQLNVIVKKVQGDIVVNTPTSIDVQTSRGTAYVCSLPGGVLKTLGDKNRSPLLPVVSVGVTEHQLLSALGENCFHLESGWWSYHVCHGVGVTQTHGTQQVNLLGSIAGRQHDLPSSAPAKLVGNQMRASLGPSSAGGVSSLHHYSYFFEGGSVCDPVHGNHTPRKAEVRYICNPAVSAAVVTSVDEVSPCSYVVYVETALLCAHSSYRPADQGKGAGGDITCFSSV